MILIKVFIIIFRTRVKFDFYDLVIKEGNFLRCKYRVPLKKYRNPDPFQHLFPCHAWMVFHFKTLFDLKAPFIGFTFLIRFKY